jgi:hypothetical protein
MHEVLTQMVIVASILYQYLAWYNIDANKVEVLPQMVA